MIEAIDTFATILAFPSVALIWVTEGGKELALLSFIIVLVFFLASVIIYLVFFFDGVLYFWNAFLKVDVETV